MKTKFKIVMKIKQLNKLKINKNEIVAKNS